MAQMKIAAHRFLRAAYDLRPVSFVAGTSQSIYPVSRLASPQVVAFDRVVAGYFRFNTVGSTVAGPRLHRRKRSQGFFDLARRHFIQNCFFPFLQTYQAMACNPHSIAKSIVWRDFRD